MILEEWMKRELDEVYVSTIIMKETAYKRINGIPKKQNIYILMGLNLRGYKKIIDVIVPIEDTTGFWYTKISELKSRGVEELFMVAMLDNVYMNKAIKMVYPNVIQMPSMIEFYNNSRPYIIQKNHRKLMSEMQKIYISNNMEEASKLYNELVEKYKNDKLLLMVINRYIDDIMEVIKYNRSKNNNILYIFLFKIKS